MSITPICQLPCEAPLYSTAFPGAYNERRSAIGGALFDAGAQYISVGACPYGDVIEVSFEPRSTWAEGVIQNSKFAKLLISEFNGRVNIGELSGVKVTVLRSREVQTFEDLLDVLAAWARENATPKTPA